MTFDLTISPFLLVEQGLIRQKDTVNTRDIRGDVG